MNSITTIRPELDRLNKEVSESVYLNKPLHVEFIVIERIDSEEKFILTFFSCHFNRNFYKRFPAHMIVVMRSCNVQNIVKDEQT